MRAVRYRAAVPALAAVLALAPAAALPSDERDARDTLKKFVEKKPALSKHLEEAHGYAVFPSVGKGGLGLGAAHGSGFVYEQGRLVGHSSLNQVTIGLQLGGQAYSELVLFQKDRKSTRLNS